MRFCANDPAVALFRIDLALVVSKYIGETEKVLCQVFDATYEDGVMLLFDEAARLLQHAGVVDSQPADQPPSCLGNASPIEAHEAENPGH